MGVVMMVEEKENLYALLRDSGNVLGISRSTMVALEAMIDVIKSLKCSADNVEEIYQEFVDAVNSSQPKVVPLMRLIKEFEWELKTYRNADLQERRTQAVNILERKLKGYKSSIKKLIETGAPLIRDGEMIVVHMASYMVTRLLIRAKQVLHRNFKVIVLDQLAVRSREAISALTEVGIEHITVPARDLGHYLEGSSKLIAAAATITKDHKIMAAAGTTNIVNSCKLNRVPAYMLTPSYHFYNRSYKDLNIHKESKSICDGNCQYDLTSHSHDILDMDRFDFFVTEHGIMKNEEYMARYGGEERSYRGQRPVEAHIGEIKEEEMKILQGNKIKNTLGYHVKKGYNIAELANQYIKQWEEKRLERDKMKDSQHLPPCICLSRKIGVGSLEIAGVLSEMVGYPVINREILEHIANSANLSDKTVHLFDGRYPGKLREFVSMAFGEKSFVQSDYTKHMFDVVFSMAGLGPAIFVGRGIHLALPRDRVLAVRIVSSRESRIERIVNASNISNEQAEDIINKVDREQGAFFRNVYRKKGVSADEFDLVISADHIRDARLAAELITLSFQKKFGEIEGLSEAAN